MKIFGEKLKSIIDVCIQKTNKNEKPLKRTKLMMNENEKKKLMKHITRNFLYYVILVNEILSICECHALHIL